MSDDIEKLRQEIYDRILKTLLEKLREAKKTATEEDLAHRCGLAQAQINRLLRGLRGEALSIRTILGVALGLNIDLASLFPPEPAADKEKIKALLDQISKVIGD